MLSSRWGTNASVEPTRTSQHRGHRASAPAFITDGERSSSRPSLTRDGCTRDTARTHSPFEAKSLPKSYDVSPAGKRAFTSLTWAQFITSVCLGDLLGDRPIYFIDNEAAKYALIKGYGSDAAVNSLLTAFWLGQAQAGSDPWFERVSSKANISDEISRNDFTIANKHGWLHVHLDFEPIWPLVLRAADDLDYACSTAFADMADRMRPQLARFRPPSQE